MSESELAKKQREERKNSKKNREFQWDQARTDMEMIRRQFDINRLSAATAGMETERREELRREHAVALRKARSEQGDRPVQPNLGLAARSPWPSEFFYQIDYEVRGWLADGVVTRDTLQRHINEQQNQREERIRLGHSPEHIDFRIGLFGRMLAWMDENNFNAVDYWAKS